jgi:Lrp/AsnC family transcriptional regulator, leucine-responsive regulatory protein
MAIDEKDKEILKIVQEDGRISTVDLALRIKLSAAAAGERLKRLVSDKVITEFTARVNPKELDLGLMVFVQVYLQKMTKKDFDAFAEGVRKAPEILECHMVMGGYDYLLKVRIKDTEAYKDFFDRVVLKLPNVRETHTYPVMEETKRFAPLPIFLT